MNPPSALRRFIPHPSTFILRIRLLTLLIAVAGAVALTAQPVPECGTTDARIRQAEELRLWSEARQKMRTGRAAPLGSSSATVQNGMFILPGDDTTAPFRKPVNLEGRTLLFTRTDHDTFVRSNVSLQYDDISGAPSQTPVDGATFSYTLRGFTFPFFGANVSTLSISGLNAIFPGTVVNPKAQQLNDAELASISVPVIAPLWSTTTVQSGQYPAVYVKELSDRLVVSWIVDRSVASYDVQAALFRNGDIRFSYKSVKRIRAAGVLITSGNEAWRSDRVELVSSTDAQGDVNGNPSATLLPLLDIDRVNVTRIASSNLIELKIKVRGTAAQLASGEGAIYVVYIGDSALRQYAAFYVTSGGDGSYSVPVWGSATASPAAHIDGDTITMNVMQETLAGSLDNVSIRMYSQSATGSAWADWCYVTANLNPPTRSIRTDFAAQTSDELTGPVQEAFTLPVLSVGGVWSEIKDAFGLTDAAVDGVAIYQNFLTDLVLYAGAYSTGGNAGATGIKTSGGLGPGYALTPALLHMNAVSYGWNATPDRSGHVVMHEFGHRWLLQINIMEDGQKKRVLNPASAHPAQYVHTPASFQVVSATDASVMGGSKFTDNSNGTFTAPAFSNFAYSWLDLYLMGLADKREVPPWFYIAGSDPKLGDAYYPPDNITVNGTRKDVEMSQVIDAMGERQPAYPATQRSFKVLFVLVTDPDRPPTADELAAFASYRKQLETKFPIATGGRATVSASFATGGPRRRSAGR